MRAITDSTGELTAPIRQVERCAPCRRSPCSRPCSWSGWRYGCSGWSSPKARRPPGRGAGHDLVLLDDGLLGVEVDGRPVRDLEPGEGFDEIALLRSGIRTATVVARRPSVLWSLDGDVFLAALRPTAAGAGCPRRAGGGEPAAAGPAPA